MGVLIMIGQVLLGLSLLIVLHELGHFLAARAFGIKVEKFYLFFDAWGVKLFSFNYKGCEYGIGWLPLGGYVKIAGMIDESMDTEQLKNEPQDWDYRSKPAWQRLIVMLGGVIVNIIVGIFIFWMLTFKMGETDLDNTKLVNGVVPGIIGKEVGIQTGDRIVAINGKPAVNFFQDIAANSEVLMGDAVLSIDRKGEKVDIKMPADVLNKVADHKASEFVQPRSKMTAVNMVQEDSEAEKMGMLVGDSIVSVNGHPIVFFDEFKSAVDTLANKAVVINVIRDGSPKTLTGKVSAEKTVGFSHKADLTLPIVRKEYTLAQSFPIGAAKAFTVITDNIKGFGKIFKGEVRADKALAGPVGIATMFGTEVDWVRFWSLVGMLSMALAFMNLLPIPALDGGHVIFLTIEIIQGKPLSDNFLEKAQMVGFFILIGLMIFVFGSDIMKLVN
ncbi:RIP metalloprotease RseP [Sphingobacterium hungaricum]|uniref:Zinc metalloprotease n=1 Tax=Sphingobacterium hungaricum TaxID=2082723 RepID=A0A928V0D4_9SPHI|nr:RIP metalloprotease RseP [Sphingobacterium hungaricum]MBE8714651.1 RIP metalloprotease RseP [Sphingobacterium hungaricum]